VEAALVTCDDAGCPVADFDDVGFGHAFTIAGKPALLSDSRFRSVGTYYAGISDRLRSPQKHSDGSCACAYRPPPACHSISCGNPRQRKSAASNIRQSGELVNEMGIQICVRDTPAVLSAARKTNRTISPSARIGTPTFFAFGTADPAHLLNVRAANIDFDLASRRAESDLCGIWTSLEFQKPMM
jgi:hypothetical protein